MGVVMVPSLDLVHPATRGVDCRAGGCAPVVWLRDAGGCLVRKEDLAHGHLVNDASVAS